MLLEGYLAKEKRHTETSERAYDAGEEGTLKGAGKLPR